MDHGNSMCRANSKFLLCSIGNYIQYPVINYNGKQCEKWMCIYMHACMLSRFSCIWLCNPTDCRLICPWDSLGKNTGAGCLAFLQGIIQTQGSNWCLLHLLHWQADSLPLVPLGKLLNSRNHILWSDGILVSISNFISGILTLGGRCLKFLLYRFSTGL